MGILCGLQAINSEFYDDAINGDYTMIAEIIEDDDSDDQCAFDRTWDGIDFILARTRAGSNALLSFLKTGGIEITDEGLDAAG